MSDSSLAGADASSSGREAVSASISLSDQGNNWISWNPEAHTKRPTAIESADTRRRIRAQASKSSAAQRKATIASRAAKQGLPPPRNRPIGNKETLQGAQDVLSRAHRLGARLADLQTDSPDAQVVASGQAHFRDFVDVLHRLENQQLWLTQALKETTLAQTSIRVVLRDAMVVDPALFQSSLFVSGTYSNTCGLAHSDVTHGLVLTYMRGASLEAVNSAITSGETGPWTSMAVALLAGWELLFGDRAAFEIHMGAYQLFDTSLNLAESSIAMLNDYTFQSMRERLNEASAKAAQPGSDVRLLTSGFRVLQSLRPEILSLFSITVEAASFDHRTEGALHRIRSLGLQCIFWSPYHSKSVKPSPTFEGDWNEAELIAVYHLRAAVLSVIALHSHLCHTMLGAKTYLDIMAAADLHALACINLRTDALRGTKFYRLAVWARWVLCVISRDPSRDHLLRQWLASLKIATWEQLRTLLSEHMLLETFEGKSRELFGQLYG